MNRRRAFLAGTAAIATGYAFATLVPTEAPTPGLTTLSGLTMGTYFRILVPDAAKDTAALNVNAAATLNEVDRLMSTYKPSSEVSLLNLAGLKSPVPVSAPTQTVIGEAIRVGDLTGGAFDVTVGPLVELWGFGASGRTQAIPDTRLISQAARRVGMESLRSGEGTAWKTRPGLGIDLSGIAKGYAVDRLAATLDSHGVPDYLVDVGGELRAKGRRPDGTRWKIGIERPSPGTDSIQTVVALENRSIATSGDYRNFFMQGGETYSHVIDPRTARPVRHSLASVTVLDRDAMTADALSTALMVMGPAEGFDFAERNGIAAYFITREGSGLIDRYTPAFEPRLDQLA